jgi:DNA polymerase-1
MERRGVMIDRDYIQTFSGELSRYVHEVEGWVKTHYGCTPGSSDAIINALRRDGVNLVKRTASGARFSLDKEVLASINHPLAQVVLQHRQAQKLVSTYLQNYLEMAGPDDIIHPSINTIGGLHKNSFEPGGGSGVRTGRMSMSNPNLQNVPIRTELGAKIRKAFLAELGSKWLKADADQIEMRILAHLSGDQAMKQAFLGEGDFFVNMARQLFHEPDFQKDDPRRAFVKNGGYAKIYGSGIDKFADTVGVDSQTAAAFMTQFDATFPGVPIWTRSVEREAIRNRDAEGISYVRSPMTNRRHVADPGKEWNLVNYEIQGMAGEILKLKIVEADAAGLGEFMRFPVHDEFNLNVPDEEVSDVMTTLTDVLNDDKLLGEIPLTWSAGVAQRWGEIK